MHLELLPAAHVAADGRVLDEAHDLHDDRLGRLVTDHAAHAGLAPRAVGRGRRRFGHQDFSFAVAFAAFFVFAGFSVFACAFVARAGAAFLAWTGVVISVRTRAI